MTLVEMCFNYILRSEYTSIRSLCAAVCDYWKLLPTTNLMQPESSQVAGFYAIDGLCLCGMSEKHRVEPNLSEVDLLRTKRFSGL